MNKAEAGRGIEEVPYHWGGGGGGGGGGICQI